MDGTTRAPAASDPPVDDPWADLAAPEVPAVPVPGDAVKPTMPWDVPDRSVPTSNGLPGDPAVDAPGPDGAPTAEPGSTVVVPSPVPAPEPVPTALAASARRVSFPPGVAAKLGAYVYLLVDARTGRIFHVGRGRGDRCFRHVEAARAPSDDPAADGGPGGRFAGLDRIRDAESDGRPVRIEILRHGLTGSEADLVVAAVDDALALGTATRLGSQRAPAVELGASLAKRAKIKRAHQVVLLRVGPHGADAGYASAAPRLADRPALDRHRVAAVAPVGRPGVGRPGRRRLPHRRMGAHAGPRGGGRRALVVRRWARRRPRGPLRRSQRGRLPGDGNPQPGHVRVVRATLGQHGPVAPPGPRARDPRPPRASPGTAPPAAVVVPVHRIEPLRRFR